MGFQTFGSLEDFGPRGSAVLRSLGSSWFLNPAELCFVQKLHCENAVEFGGMENNFTFSNI